MVHASPASAKTMLRLQLRDLRKQLRAETPDAPERAAALLPYDFRIYPTVVAGYRAIGSEFDPWPVMQAFARRSTRLVLPVAASEDAPLTFRGWMPGDTLVSDAFGIPSPSLGAPLVEPDLILAPLLAFDRHGGRIGQGGGHYDRTIAALRARRPVFVLGLAYAGQEVARIPTEPHDQRLDAILTEKAYIEAR